MSSNREQIDRAVAKALAKILVKEIQAEEAAKANAEKPKGEK